MSIILSGKPLILSLKKFLSLIIPCVWLCVSNVYGAPCYGTRLPEGKKFIGGFQSYTIFKRELKNNYGKLKSLQHFFQLSYGVYNWLSIDLKGGAGNIKQYPNLGDEADYSNSFAGGYGFRIRAYNHENLKIVLGFQHISVHPQSVHLGNVKNKAILDDWQGSLLASYKLSVVTPYLGVKWSRVDYIHWIGEERKRKMSDTTKSVGLICGFDFPLNAKAWVNLEGQFFDSEALAVSVNFEF